MMDALTNKIAYLLISDIHFKWNNPPNRINYNAELTYALDQIIELSKKYKEDGYYIVYIFLGDIIDNSYRSVKTALRDYTYLRYLISHADKSYLTLGNHDLRYTKNNPLWYLVNELKSKNLQKYEILSQYPKGLISDIEVADSLEHEDVNIYFNHFGVKIQIPDTTKLAIGCFHAAITDSVSQAISESKVDIKLYRGIKTNSYTELLDYDYCFMGHFHTLTGSYKKNKTVVTHLPSIGVTTASAIKDTFLERQIPVIIINNNKFSKIEIEEIKLMTRKETVLEDVVEAQQKNYKVAKERKLRTEESLFQHDDPIKNIKENYIDDIAMIQTIERIQESDSNIESSEKIQKNLMHLYKCSL